MVRAVVTVLITMFAIMAVLLAGGPVLEDIGQEIGSYDSIDNGPMEGSTMIDQLFNVVMVWMPLIVIGGIILFAVVFTFRKERVGRGGPGGGGL